MATWAAVFAAFLLAGCTSKEVYQSAQGWRHNECAKVIDADERSRCLETANTTYEEYRRKGAQAQEAGKPSQ